MPTANDWTSISVPVKLWSRIREIQTRERENGNRLTIADIISNALDVSEHSDDIFAIIDSQ
jgi:hypothetical protein